MREEKIIHLYLNYTLLNCMYRTTITQVSLTMNEEIEDCKEQFENTLEKLESCNIKCEEKVMDMYKKFYNRSFNNIHAYDHLLTNSLEKPTAPLIERQVKHEFREEFTIVSDYNKKLLEKYFPDIENRETTPFANKISCAAYHSDFFLTNHIDTMLMDKWSFDTDGSQFDVRRKHKEIFERFDKNLDSLNIQSIKENDIPKNLVAKEIAKYTGKRINDTEKNRERDELKSLLEEQKKTEVPKNNGGNRAKQVDKVAKKEDNFKKRRYSNPFKKLAHLFKGKRSKLSSFSLNINSYVLWFVVPVIICALALLFNELGWFASGDNFFIKLNEKVNFVDGYGKWAEGIQGWLSPALEDFGTIQSLLAFVLFLPLTLIAYVLEGAWWLVSWVIIGIIKLLIFLIGKIIFLIAFLLYGGGIVFDVMLFAKSDEKDTSIVLGFIVSLLLCTTLGILILI